MKNKIILVGFFQEVIELCYSAGKEIVGIIDNNIEQGEYNGFKILGTDNDAKNLFAKYGKIPLVLSPDLPVVRKKLYMLYSELGYEFGNVISPDARISESVTLGKGIFIQSGVNISSNTKICDFTRLNTNSNIMHDCIINKFSTIAPNAVILGNVKIGKYAYIGSNCTILPNCKVGSNSTVGAGSVITKNIEPATVVVGNPGKVLEK